MDKKPITKGKQRIEIKEIDDKRRAYSFGHPDIETVDNQVFPSPSAPNEGERYLNLDVVHANHAERIVGLNQQQTELSEILKNWKKEGYTCKELVQNSNC
ncbi:hypothetical protein FRX31_031263 [Thalictrum thalictroides]|uniref:Uncharacterized protein n=1 Tax=Thalictrum thalictroides TaxID=46969 RepID=A0A7J6V2Y1_THATH|nr:hypothetical protein FRX31_031263 [Thalictrum thalictroides]